MAEAGDPGGRCDCQHRCIGMAGAALPTQAVEVSAELACGTDRVAEDLEVRAVSYPNDAVVAELRMPGFRLVLRRRTLPSTAAGRLSWREGHLIIEIFLRKDHAHATFRILEPIATATNEISAGLWLAFDLDGTLVAGPIVFTRDELALGDGEALLKSRISTVSSYKLLEVPTRRRTGKKHPP